ncbi:hypothetical protein vseg_020633 [Gypsophila vaccaria]
MDPQTTSLLPRQPSDEETVGNLVGSARNDGSSAGFVAGPGVNGSVPVAKVSGEEDEDDDDDEVFGEEEEEVVERGYGVQKDVPRVRVVDEDDEEEEEWGEPLEEPEVETDNGDVGGSGENGTLKSGFEEVEEGDAVVDSINVDAVEAVGSGVAVVGTEEKKGSEVEPVGEVDSSAGEGVGVTLSNGDDELGEGDAVVDSINVDAVEAVRSGVAVVGAGEKTGSEVEPVEEAPVEEKKPVEVDSSAVEDVGVTSTGVDEPVTESTVPDVVESGSVVADDKGHVKDSEVEVKESVDSKESVSVDSEVTEPAAGVKYTDDGDAVVDSIKVDAAEAVRSRTAVVGDVEEVKGSGAGEESVVVEPAAPLFEDSAAEKIAPEDPKAIETDETNSVAETDAVVDAIDVDAVEAIRSGVAVVGKSESEGVEIETKEADVPVAANVPLASDFASLADLNSSEVADAPGVEQREAQTEEAEAPQPVEVSELKETQTNEAEAPRPAEVSELKEAQTNEAEAPQPGEVSELKEAQTNEAEAPRSVEISELQNTGNTEPETDSASKEHEPTGEPQLPGGENEKVRPGHAEKEPEDSSVSVEGENASNRSYASVLVDGLDVATSEKNDVEETEVSNPGIEVEADDGRGRVAEEKGDDEGSDTDEEGDVEYIERGSASRNVIEDLDTHDQSGMMGGQVVTDSEEEGESDEEGEGNELFDSAALAALLKAATGGGSDPGTITVRSQDGSRLFSMERPVGLEPSLRSARPATGMGNSSFFSPTNIAPPVEENLSEEEKKKLEFLQQLKVKFLRLVQRNGFTAENSLAAQVLYKLTVVAGRPVSPAYSLDNAKQTATQLEAEGKDDLDFSFNILVLGKTGVGKSAIINSLFGEEKVKINAFEPETTSANVVSGTLDGVKIRFIDAPGLKSSAMEQNFNRKVLASVKKLTKKYPPDVMFYVDRLDSQTRDLNDIPLLKTISNSLGNSIWRNAIITLTHASSAPPDGPSGAPLSYEVFVAQRSHIVQQSIGQAVGEMRLMNLNMMNPVSLVENHPACRKNREGQKILPNGQAWRPQLLLLCYSVKILSEANAVSKPSDAFDPRKLFGFRSRSPPLPYLLSSLLQPRAHPKLSADQGGDSVDSDIDLDDVSDSDQEEEENEYDQLPPFKPLKRAQIAKLSNEQKKAYFEEYDYRVKLLQRKQWREEIKRMREMKKNGKNGGAPYGEMPEDYDGENGAPAAVPVPLPDMTLPPSFDSDNPAYRYRFLEPTSQFLARPVLDPHGWDHDCGYEGVNVEHSSGIAERFPASFTIQLNKDKKDFNVHLDSAVSAKHGENGSSLLGFDVQTIGKQYAYIVRGESKFKNLKKNKTAAGVTVTFLGENVATGVKVEDQIILGKRLVLLGSTGTVRSQKDAAYGANLEVRLREADYPIGQEQSSFTLSLMKWRGDLAIGANLQSQVSVGRNSKVAVRAALNNKMSGQITVRTSSSDHLSLALAGLMPIAVAIYRKLWPGDVSENYAIY